MWAAIAFAVGAAGLSTNAAAATTGAGALGEPVSAWWPLIGAVAVSVALFGLARWALARRRRLRGVTSDPLHTLAHAALILAALIAAILTVPIGDATRGQLLSLLGIVLSAAIALSSTTFIGNAMAGLMLRVLKHTKPGDFLRVGDLFGRVTEQGLLHTELQTEERNLVTVPNLHLVTTPVEVVRASGTLVRGEVSLGYDVPRDLVEERLLRAAEAVGLGEPFVRVVDLGDFSVTYRVSGLLDDGRLVLSRRAALNAAIIDALHGAGVEIVSPNFVNQRVFPVDARFIARPGAKRSSPPSVAADAAVEERVFDKAEQAASGARPELEAELAEARAEVERLSEALDKASEEERAAAQAALTAAVARAAELEARLSATPS